MGYSKSRVFGEQIIVYLTTSDDNNLVVDFDNLQTRLSPSNTYSYKTIGRGIPNTHISYDGWDLTLTRAKRDNFLNSLIHRAVQLSNLGRGNVDLIVKRRIVHTYSPPNIAEDDEMAKALAVKSIYSEDIFKKKSLEINQENIQGALKTITPYVSSYVQHNVNSYIENNAQQLTNPDTYDKAQGAVNSTLNFIKGISSTPQIPLIEEYEYEGCKIIGFEESDSPKTETSQVLTLKASRCTSNFEILERVSGIYRDSAFLLDPYTKYLTNKLLTSHLKEKYKDIDMYEELFESLNDSEKIFVPSLLESSESISDELISGYGD